MLMNVKFVTTRGKSDVVADALSRKDPAKTSNIRAMNTNTQNLKDIIRHTQQQVLIKGELKRELTRGADQTS